MMKLLGPLTLTSLTTAVSLAPCGPRASAIWPRLSGSMPGTSSSGIPWNLWQPGEIDGYSPLISTFSIFFYMRDITNTRRTADLLPNFEKNVLTKTKKVEAKQTKNVWQLFSEPSRESSQNLSLKALFQKLSRT